MKLVVWAAGIALLGCKSEHESPAPKRPELEIIAAGAPPLAVARYHLAKGAKTRFELASDFDMTAGGAGGALPTFVLELEVACEDVLPDGRMKLRTTVVDVSARDRPESKIAATSIAAPIQALRGVAVTATLSPDGHVTDSHVDSGAKQLPAAATQQLGSLASSLEQIAMPLPDQPIGAGAKWRGSRTFTQGGMTMTMVSTIDATAVAGDKLTFTVESTVHGPDQTVTQEGTAIAVKDITGNGTGHGAIDLATMVMDGQLTAEFRADMSTPGELDTPMRMSLVMTMAPR